MPEQGWIIEMVAYDVSVNLVFFRRRGLRSSTPAWNRWTEPLREAEDLGGGAGAVDAQVDRTGRARARLEIGVHEAKTRPSAKLQPITCGQRGGGVSLKLPATERSSGRPRFAALPSLALLTRRR